MLNWWSSPLRATGSGSLSQHTWTIHMFLWHLFGRFINLFKIQVDISIFLNILLVFFILIVLLNDSGHNIHVPALATGPNCVLALLLTWRFLQTQFFLHVSCQLSSLSSLLPSKSFICRLSQLFRPAHTLPNGPFPPTYYIFRGQRI